MTTTADTPETTQPPGATLHLGGHAYASPSLEPLLFDRDLVTPYPGNPRLHEQDQITASIRDHGLYQGIVAQRSTGHVLVGNGRLEALTELGATRVPVTWMDVDDTRARAIVARDNLTSDLSTNDDLLLYELLAPLASDAEVLALSGYDTDDLADLLRALEPDPEPTVPDIYTRKHDPIHYEPTMDAPPPTEELVNRTKANDLIAQITAADLPGDVRDFLIAGAQRHLVFDYAKVAEFYAHASVEVQRLMEASALVVVDFEDAIKHGYVRLSERLRDLLDLDLEHRAGLDSRSAGLRDA